ncbi:MAG TPA: hypothetical protein PLL54_08010, partial [Dermatophilaceae bacterium]|nr:hypothetical protein [Dermatophilaceae bacterium]
DLRQELLARSAAVSGLVDRCVAQVSPAPRLAVPDVRALGDIPAAADDVDAYLAKLDAVSRALTVVHTAYSGALAERDEVQGYAGALTAQVRAAGVSDPDLEHLRTRLDTVLAATPTDMTTARALLAAYEAYFTARRAPAATRGRTR